MKEIVEKLFDSWSGAGKIDKTLFSKEFIFDGASELLDAEVWLDADLDDISLETKILNLAVCGNKATLFFEYKDPITLLIYRVCWLVTIETGLISRIVEVSEALQREKL